MGPEANDWCPEKREIWTQEKPCGQGLGEAGGSSALRCLDGGLLASELGSVHLCWFRRPSRQGCVSAVLGNSQPPFR